MTIRVNPRLLTILAAMAYLPPLPPVCRCDPVVDDKTRATLTVLCHGCNRRLGLDDIGNGMPECPGKAKGE